MIYDLWKDKMNASPQNLQIGLNHQILYKYDQSPKWNLTKINKKADYKSQNKSNYGKAPKLNMDYKSIDD